MTTASNASEIRILVVDDDAKMVGILEKHLQRMGYEVTRASGPVEALSMMDNGLQVDVLLSDVKMPGVDGRTLMTVATERRPGLRVVLMTGFGTVAEAVEAMRDGAFWYLTKPFRVEDAAVILRRAATEIGMERRMQRLEDTLRSEYHPTRYLGRSAIAEMVRSELTAAAKLNTPVLLIGKTGSGKELAARIIHRSSARAEGPFVPVNCSAIPELLFESELFGHRRGAFTGATQDSPGLLEEANGGTLFLDEVADLPVSQQPKLLRVLEDSAIRRVGERSQRRVDVRVIAATNRPVQEMKASGLLREDLYYRLSALVIALPSINERPDDLEALAGALLVDCARAAGVRAKGFTRAALEELRRYEWPGNVRELRNAIDQSLFRARGPVIDAADLPIWVTGKRSRRASDIEGVLAPAERLPTLAEIEREHVERVLASTEWNRTQAARILGIDRRTLFTRMRDYGLVGPTREPGQ